MGQGIWRRATALRSRAVPRGGHGEPRRGRWRAAFTQEARLSTPNASPLSWPIRQERTPRARRRINRLWRGATVSTASLQVEDEVRRLGGDELVISTNLALRVDGFPRSGQPEPVDPGVAVYFRRKAQQIVLACDRYSEVAENLRAIAMHLEALRGMERWGVGSLDQAFAGYAALPESSSAECWWSVLGCQQAPKSTDELRAVYLAAAKRSHPDAGGSNDAFLRVQRAFEQGQAALGGAA